MNIKNEVKITDKDFEKKKFVVRNAADVQRAKLEKLMKNPEKPVIIPEGPRERDFSNAIPSFVRNVMGSSAGAGSGEFHVYRHLRRKEYARQKHIQEKSRSEQMDEDFQHRLEENKRLAEEKTAKKRAKRLKKKSKQKANRGKKPKKEEEEDMSDSEEDEDEEEEVGNKLKGDDEKREAEKNQGKTEQDEANREHVIVEEESKTEGTEAEGIQPTDEEEKHHEEKKDESLKTLNVTKSSNDDKDNDDDGEDAKEEEK